MAGQDENGNGRWKALQDALQERMPSAIYPGRSWEPGEIEGIPPWDSVKLVVRQHPAALATPGVRTGLGLLAVVSSLSLLPLVLFAGAVALELRRRLHVRLRTCAVAAAVTVVVMLVFAGSASPVLHRLLVVVVLLGWLGVDVVGWHHDRLVVTTKRLYRISGVFVRHIPSVALTGIAFIDAVASPLGRALHYGTLVLDSAAQNDQPLSHFDFVPDLLVIHARVLELRAAAMPTWPRPPG